jgi:hypothetical protein
LVANLPPSDLRPNLCDFTGELIPITRDTAPAIFTMPNMNIAAADPGVSDLYQHSSSLIARNSFQSIAASTVLQDYWLL